MTETEIAAEVRRCAVALVEAMDLNGYVAPGFHSDLALRAALALVPEVPRMSDQQIRAAATFRAITKDAPPEPPCDDPDYGFDAPAPAPEAALCPKCAGTGNWMPGTKHHSDLIKCPACGGTGRTP